MKAYIPTITGTGLTTLVMDCVEDSALLVFPDSDSNNDFRTEISVGESTIEVTKYEDNILRRFTYQISDFTSPGIDDRGNYSVNPVDDFIGTQEDWNNRA